jgi:hypothetical protein
MAPDINWQRYDELKAQGISERQIAERLGVARSTLQDHLKRQGLAPVQRPVQNIDTGAVSSVDTGAVQILDTAAVQRIDQLEGEVQGLCLLIQSVIDRLDQPAVQAPVQITALPPYPKGKAVRWNLWILEPIRDEIATLAAERDISPSQLVQELLWKALSDHHSSKPSTGGKL